MTPIGLKTGERAQWSAQSLISLKTGDVLELTISPETTGLVGPSPEDCSKGSKHKAARLAPSGGMHVSRKPFPGYHLRRTVTQCPAVVTRDTMRTAGEVR